MYSAIIASVFLLRVGLPHQAKARLVLPPSPPPPPWEPLPPEDPGAQAPSPIVVAAAARPPAPIRNCLRFRAILFLRCRKPPHRNESVFATESKRFLIRLSMSRPGGFSNRYGHLYPCCRFPNDQTRGKNPPSWLGGGGLP